MADKVTLMKKWFDDIREDENLFDLTETDIAYLIYAAAQYGFTGEKVNLGEVFGKEYRGLNMAMPNIYGQIDRIKNFNDKVGGSIKYDSEAIKELRLKGMTALEICRELGYPAEKVKSLTSNKGWKEAGELMAAQKKNDNKNEEKIDRNETDFRQKIDSGVQKNPESIDLSIFEF